MKFTEKTTPNFLNEKTTPNSMMKYFTPNVNLYKLQQMKGLFISK